MSKHEPRIKVREDEASLTWLEFSGDFKLGTPPAELNIPSNWHGRTIHFVDAGITRWDSTLLAAVSGIRKKLEAAGVASDYTGLPAGAVRLLDLAFAVPEREGSRREAKKDDYFTRVGKFVLGHHDQVTEVINFIGEAVLSLGRLVTGRARYRKSDLWLVIQQCGPQAIGIITTISVLVGAILAFVGSIQLKMFGAEIYVANLVGLGMVMEMGALMTGIILAGRTGASFAAQLGTMQVNEEIDALKTMGIPPMDYLVMPRMLALTLMTPLLVVYADVLGIIGGGFVGVLLLNMSPTVYFNQTIEMMSLWYCSQGLIKGSTFGLLIAFCGCLAGIRCGRSASSVGQAATTAVVSSIVAIVVADAIWTFIFMVIE
ncbi:MAG: MlaE family ABC transporter permease [Kiritimatiellia bacterium]